MSTLVRFSDQQAFVARWTTRLDARDALVVAIEAASSFPAGATLELLNPRTGSPAEASLWMENRINQDRELWQANLVGPNPHEKVGIEDIRKFATELGVPVPAGAI